MCVWLDEGTGCCAVSWLGWPGCLFGQSSPSEHGSIYIPSNPDWVTCFWKRAGSECCILMAVIHAGQRGFFQHSCSDVLVRSSSFQGLEAGMISVSSKWADPSCSVRFDQTLPLAWQIQSRGSFVNAWASKKQHKTRCIKCTNISDQTLINRHNSRKWGGFGKVAWCGPEEEMVEPGQFTFIFSTHTRGKIKHVCLVQLNERNYFQLK